MKEQSNENPTSKYDEVEHLKCKKRFYRYEDTEKSIYLSKKQFLKLNNNHNNNNQKLNGRFNNEFNGIEEVPDEEILIRETQAALKSLSGSWCESNTIISETIETDESPTFPNLFEEKNGSRKMSPATALPLNSNYDLSSYRHHYSHMNGRPISVIQSKKLRPNEEKFQSHDFNELVDDGTDDDHHQHNNKMSKSEKISDSVTYEMNSDYRMPSTSFSVQSSAFRPPLSDGNKKSNSFASMPLSAYQYTDPNGGYYEKPFAKEDEMNAHDSKEYTTLQPAGIGSKAATVIQDIARDGVASVSVVSNSTAQNPTSTHSNAERTFIERPAFSPGSTNKGKFKSQKD